MRQLYGLVIAMLALSVTTARAAGAGVQVICASGTSRAVAVVLNLEISRQALTQEVTLSAPSVAVNSNGAEVTVCVTMTLGNQAR